MAELPTGRDREKDDDMAAAEGLFDDAHAPRPQRHQASPTPGGVEGFDLADDEPAPVRRPTAPRWEEEDDDDDEPLVAKRPGGRPRIASASAVDQVWTRWAEWGADLALVGLWALLILFLLYVTLSGEYYTMAMTVLALGLFGGAALCYPLLITLERPVRMSPERALKDFYDALSHHRPHYRRMWLLLSNAGKTSSKFASYEGFKKYWSDELKRLKVAHEAGSTPLMFQVAEFKDKKHADKTVADASWTTVVFVRGQRSRGPILARPMVSSFSKGPDNMWYIDEGTFEEAS